MNSLVWWLSLLVGVLLAAGCSPSEPSVPAVDDDDSADWGDDDSSDDDDAQNGACRAVSFSFELEVEQVADGAAELTAEYVFTYWLDYDYEEMKCEQHRQMTGSGFFGPGEVDGCESCAGVLVFDPASVLDSGDPSSESSHCTAEEELAPYCNVASFFVEVPAEGEWGGDFLSMAVLEAGELGALDWPEFSPPASHAGLVRGDASALGTGAYYCLPGEAWCLLWVLSPTTEPEEAIEMEGSYTGEGLVGLSWAFE